MPSPSRALRWNLFLTDLGFLLYWGVTALGVLPSAWLFQDYRNPILVAWNGSFAPIDLLASLLGLTALAMARQGRRAWRGYALVSLTLTFCAGFMALAFWSLRRDFDLGWWLPNIYLAAWPLCLGRQLIGADAATATVPLPRTIGRTHRRRLCSALTALLAMPLPGLLACAATPGDRAVRTMLKGVELYSWPDSGGGSWRFALLPGTNRDKTFAEIRHSRDAVDSVAELKVRLARLAPSEEVFWRTTGRDDRALPPKEVIDDIIAYAASVDVRVHPPGG